MELRSVLAKKEKQSEGILNGLISLGQMLQILIFQKIKIQIVTQFNSVIDLICGLENYCLHGFGD